MKILIIGGTKFLGRHLLEAALQNDHDVTLFNRGKIYADDSLPAVEQIHGDRHVDLEKLAGRRFDAVIDTCGYLPQSVEIAARFFADKAAQYVFISSGSVYAETCQADYDENAPLAELDETARKKFAEFDLTSDLNGLVLGAHYGALKVLCERAAEAAMPGRVLTVRAGMIVGAFDWTDRFNYWVMRVARGGRVLAPGSPENFVQLIDARDLSAWIVRMIERGENGIFNATSESLRLTFGEMLAQIKAAVKSDAEFVWANEEFLTENNVAPWSEMPFYLPESDEAARNFLTMNVDRALAKNLKFRLLADTAADVYRWRAAQNFEMRAGISAEREKQLLEKTES